MSLHSTIVCGGCGASPPADDPYPFRCPHAGDGDGGDHVLRRVLDTTVVAFPDDDGEIQPFVRFRRLFHAHQLARAAGVDDEELVEMVRALDSAVAAIDGRGLRTSPFEPAPGLAGRVGLGSGSVFVKDETAAVAGSHKARHLFGILVHLEIVERLGLAPAAQRPPLAIASCGNAALAAAVVAAAGRRELQVFVPADAPPDVVHRLGALGAEVVVCQRTPGVAGDPTYLRLLAAIDAGALPFTCQGNLNGLAIEGGETLGYEIASTLAGDGTTLHHVVIQVGGGALASAVAQSLQEAVELGVIASMPVVHTVQTESAWPLRRAHQRVIEMLQARAGAPSVDQISEAMHAAAARRAQFMWPWETTPHSIAHGILDDETYDWLAVVEAMLHTGGRALVVGEGELSEANRIAVETTGIDVDETGSAGLAGLARLVGDGTIRPDENVALLFTGVRRTQ